MYKNRFILRNVVAVAICLAGIVMFASCEDPDEKTKAKYQTELKEIFTPAHGPDKTWALVRFAKDTPYCFEMSVFSQATNGILTGGYVYTENAIVSHNFNESQLSDYYPIPAGNHVPVFWYTNNQGETSWAWCMPKPYTYSFEAGHRYTVFCFLEDGQFFRTYISSDGEF